TSESLSLVWTSQTFFFSSRRRHTIFSRDWSSDVCSSDLRDPLRGPLRARTHGSLSGEDPGLVEGPGDGSSARRGGGHADDCSLAPPSCPADRGSGVGPGSRSGGRFRLVP